MNKNRENQRGLSTLVLVFVIASLLALIVLALQLNSLLAARRASQVQYSQTSFFAAEGYLYKTIQYLQNNPGWPDPLPREDNDIFGEAEIKRKISQTADCPLEVDITATIKNTKRRLVTCLIRGESSATPLDIVLVLDHSGSMHEGGNNVKFSSFCWPDLDNDPGIDTDCAFRILDIPLKDAQYGSIKLLEYLNNTLDYVGVVGYSNSARGNDLLDLTLTYDDVKNKIIGFNASGATNIAEAIYQATTKLDSSPRTEATKVIILLTDGVANRSHINCSICGFPNPPCCGSYPCLETCCILDAINQANAAKNDPRSYIIFSIFLNKIAHADGGCTIVSVKDRASNTLKEIASEPEHYYETTEPEDLTRIYEEIAQTITSPTFFEIQEELPEPD